MKLCVIGGGNIGTLLTAEFAYRGFDVTLYSSSINCWSPALSIYDENNVLLYKSNRYRVTNDLKTAVEGADYIWITYPAFMFSALSKEMNQVLHPGQMVICVPGSGGAEFAFNSVIQRGVIFGGLQRVHCISRIKEKGSSVYALGRKESVQLGAIPSNATVHHAKKISDMLNMNCDALPNYLNVTLTPSNPILHTARLYTLFHDFHKGKFYNHNILFYEEWNNESSRIMLMCDEEHQKLCQKLNQVVPVCVNSLRKHYNSYSTETMTEKISGIKAFRGIYAPMKQIEKGWIPDFSSRYFTADFPYGIKVLIEIAKRFEVAVPMMEIIWNWYSDIQSEKAKNAFCLPDIDFNSLYI